MPENDCVFQQSRGPVVSWSRSPVVPWSRSLVVAHLSLSQSFADTPAHKKKADPKVSPKSQALCLLMITVRG